MSYDPMLATPTTGSSKSYVFDLPTLNRGGSYIAQYKLDGHRAMLHKSGDRVAIYSRNGKNITEFFPYIKEEAIKRLPAKIILDGELMTDSRNPNDLNHIIAGGSNARVARFYPFDVPSIAHRPLHERLTALRFIRSGLYIKPLQAHSDLEGAMDKAKAAGHEGVVVKNIGSPYEFGKRSKYWLKFKAVETITCVVSQFDTRDGRLTVMMLSLVDEQSDLVLVGKVAGGWNKATGDELLKRLQADEVTLVDVEYLPGSGTLRFGTFRAIRDDLSITSAHISQIG